MRGQPYQAPAGEVPTGGAPVAPQGWAGPERRASPRPPPTHETLLLDLGLPCPLACVGCERAARRSGPPALDLARGRLREAALRSGVQRVRAVLFGGDPFLAPPGELCEALREAGALCRERGAEFVVQAISPGTEVTRERARELAEAGLRRVQVNLAGPRATHDRLRPMLDGSGSFDRILVGLAAGHGALEFVARIEGHPGSPEVTEVTQSLEAAGLLSGGHPVELWVAPRVSYRQQACELVERG